MNNINDNSNSNSNSNNNNNNNNNSNMYNTSNGALGPAEGLPRERDLRQELELADLLL